MIFEPQVIHVCVEEEDIVCVNAEVSVTHSEADYYTGEYIVTPLPQDETVLETNGKYMSDDVTVLKIPYYETSNESGKTAYIGSEV